MAAVAVQVPVVSAQFEDVVVESWNVERVPLYVPPGASAVFSITMHNESSAPVGSLRMRAVAEPFQAPHWTFEALLPERCSEVTLVSEPQSPLSYWQFEVAGLAAGEQLECRYRLSRDPTPRGDTLLAWDMTGPNGQTGGLRQRIRFVIGHLTELQMAIAPFCERPAVEGTRMVRVTIENRGPHPVRSVGFGSCIDHGFPDFVIDGEIESGCGPNVGSGHFCFGSSLGWFVGDLDVGGSHSCLLALRDRSIPVPVPQPFRVEVPQPYFTLPEYVSLLDEKSDFVGGELSTRDPSYECHGTSTPVQIPAGRPFLWLMLMLATISAAARVLAGTVSRN